MADGGKMDLTEAKFRNFLTKLAHDDDFRKGLEEDPAGTLETEGISVDPAELPETVELPPKAEVARRLEAGMEEARARAFVPIVFPWLGARGCGDVPKPPPPPPKPKP